MELNTRSKIHLEWMFENQPQLVRDLHRSNKLEPHLDNKYQQALELQEKFMKAGQSSEEAFQNASDLILAPSDGPALSDNPPAPEGAAGNLQEAGGNRPSAAAGGRRVPPAQEPAKPAVNHV
jgi:hypothetical protein